MSRHHARREGRRSRSAADGHPQTLFFSNVEANSCGSLSSSSWQYNSLANPEREVPRETSVTVLVHIEVWSYHFATSIRLLN
ncbi:E3 ubiquitin-protein ligase RHF2A-like [Panicum miliaceum]|uniref:E3 ubiquitin-protein ligase RHF2A-like n=1 Tax=Panicum miliaceum TaxID=4540 RepID=A0A3L6Q031_PANMI|nr:E3 ubiquitin-protein ligase RHF2A-like [Panicum miliaceum]